MPLDGNVITVAQLKKQLGTKLASYWRPTKNYGGFSDETYYCPSLREIEAILGMSKNRVDGIKSKKNHFDCDDYAFALKGKICLWSNTGAPADSLCFGVAWGDFKWVRGAVQTGSIQHACNWVLTADRVLRWVEPQFAQPKQIQNLDQCSQASLRLFIA